MRRALAVGAALAIAATAVATAVGSGEVASPGERLLRTAAESPPPGRYRFEIVPDSAGLQGCFSVRRRVSGTVDRFVQRSGIEVDPVGVAAIIADGATYVHRNALVGWPIRTEWVVLSAPLEVGMTDAWTTALGADLAGLVLASALPDPPSALVAAALQAMRSAKILDPQPGVDPGTQRIEVDIDATKLAQDPSEAAAAVEEEEAPLTLVLTVGSNGEITTVSARLSPPATASDDEAFGYRITYQSDESVAVPALPDAADVTPIEAVPIPESPLPPDIAWTVGP